MKQIPSNLKVLYDAHLNNKAIPKREKGSNLLLTLGNFHQESTADPFTNSKVSAM